MKGYIRVSITVFIGDPEIKAPLLNRIGNLDQKFIITGMKNNGDNIPIYLSGLFQVMLPDLFIIQP